MRCRKTFVVVLLGASLNCVQMTAGQATVLREEADSATKALPERAAYLFEWPDTEVLELARGVRDDEDRQVARAREHSIQWIRKILDPDWQPDSDEWLRQHLSMLRNEYGPFDVTRVEWKSHGYRVQVSQMAGIIAIKLTPETAPDVRTTERRRSWAAGLCSQVINDNAARRATDQQQNSVQVPVTALRDKIIRYCFRPDDVRKFQDGSIAAACAPASREVYERSKDIENTAAENRADNANWDESLSSWGYWWRHMGWWSDGKSVGFFTLKTEGGSWHANYQDQLGARWFEGPAPLKPTSNPARNPPAAPAATP